MTIFFDHRIFLHQKSGGISRYIINLSKQFDKLGKDNFISSPIHINIMLKEHSKIKEEISGKFIGSKPLFTNKILNYLNDKISSYNFKKIDPKVYHQSYYGEFLCNKRTLKVVTVHDLIHEKFYSDYGSTKNWRPKAKSIEQSDKIICISENTKNDLKKYYDIESKDISVIYHGSDHLHNLNCDLNFVRDNFILFIGGRGKYKNFKRFIEAYSNNDKLKSNFKIVCFGGGKFQKSELNLFEKKKIINFIEHKEGSDQVLIELYKKAKCLVYPSLYEGFGLPIIEAMSFGCPVVASNSKSLKESCGSAAIFFDPKNSDDMSDKILEAVNLSKNEKIKEGLSHIKKFTWKKSAEQTLNFYEK